MIDLNPILDRLDLVLARAADIAGGDAVGDLMEAAISLRHRRGYMADVLVVALAGGTGSGKSSILNAVAGAPVASTSALRPHTDAPLAWIPQRHDAGLTELLDAVGIDDRVEQSRFPDVAIIDLPDHDSIVGAHRSVVGRLLPLVDVVAWVVDPEKYRDRVLMEEYLVPLVDYQEQFFFILNQIDRVGGEEGAVRDDLVATLRAVGYTSPLVFATAADPEQGAPVGIGRLISHIGDALDAKRLVLRRVLTDVGRLNRTAEARLGLGGAGAVGFESRWRLVMEAVSRSRSDREDVLCQLEDFVGAVAVETGGPFAERVRNRFTSSVLEREVAAAGDGRATAHLEAAVGDPLRRLLWERGRLAATIALLAVEVAQAEARWCREGGADDD